MSVRRLRRVGWRWLRVVPLCWAGAVWAQQSAPVPVPAERSAWQLRIDNDQFAAVPGRAERGYTSGVWLSAARQLAPDEALRWAGPCGAAGVDAAAGTRWRVMALEHKLWTPAHTGWVRRQPDDQPYAATLAFGVDQVWLGTDLSCALGVHGGVLGPGALGEFSQNTVHDALRQPRAQGWAWQVRAQPVAELRAQRLQRWPLPGAAWDGVTRAALTVGNPLTQLELGALWRAGAVPAVPTWPGQVRLGSPMRGWMVFGGGSARAVARDERIAGATYGGVPSTIALRPWGAELSLGVVGALGPAWSLEWAWTWRSPDFSVPEGRPSVPTHRIGTLVLRWTPDLP